jgi:hypothetical protein
METSFRGVPASVNLMFIFGRRQQHLLKSSSTLREGFGLGLKKCGVF